jgi:hypothetical protein
MQGLSLHLVRQEQPQRKVGPEKMMSVNACLGKKSWVRILGWASVATGAVAVGIYVGRNLRARYLLNHRTPLDFYSHAGDNGSNNVEYGVGI